MYVLDYPEFTRLRYGDYLDLDWMIFIINVDHPVIKYYALRNYDSKIVLLGKDEKVLYEAPIVKPKYYNYLTEPYGDEWSKLLFKKFDRECLVTNDAINDLRAYSNSSRFATVAVAIYQKIKHEYEMENLTREFSNFRKSFDEKLDRIIDTITKKPSEPTAEPVVETVVKEEPKRISPTYTVETIWKSCKNIGIAKTAVKFEITEDEVRKLKKEYKNN